MVVSHEIALGYELSDGDMSEEDRAYFIHARTIEWETRLADYHTGLARRSQPQGSTYAGEPGHDASAVPYLEAWQHRETLASHRAKRVGTEFYGFLTLPGEIRRLIYSMALVKGKVFVPSIETDPELGVRRFTLKNTHDLDGQRYLRYDGLPYDVGNWREKRYKQFGLISGVNKLIQDEATNIFLRGNQFVFPTGNYGHLVCFSRSYERALCYGRLVRDVSFPFDMRDCVASDINARYDHEGDDVHPVVSFAELHDYRHSYLEKVWARRIKQIRKMELDRLQLTFDECYCESGCCRKVSWVCDELVRDWDVLPPKVIEVVGWLDDDERQKIQERFGCLSEASMSVLVRFEGWSKAVRKSRFFECDPCIIAPHTSDNVLADFDWDAFLAQRQQGSEL
ncbi:hypothetical protein BJ170DRAFT_678791 [Xylariales sp. AK1849]|nr:hypothetical protein BJ170DRAFT_678791 [Xylariales sp. AK1849]